MSRSHKPTLENKIIAHDGSLLSCGRFALAFAIAIVLFDITPVMTQTPIDEYFALGRLFYYAQPRLTDLDNKVVNCENISEFFDGITCQDGKLTNL